MSLRAKAGILVEGKKEKKSEERDKMSEERNERRGGWQEGDDQTQPSKKPLLKKDTSSKTHRIFINIP